MNVSVGHHAGPYLGMFSLQCIPVDLMRSFEERASLGIHDFKADGISQSSL